MSRVADAAGSPAQTFAETLRDAIDRRGLGLERIRDHLEARGVSVSVATLSYWQSGRSQPERKASLEALPHLEAVLDLAVGSLRGALPTTRDRGRRGPVQGLDAVWPEPPQTRVLRRLDTSRDAELDRLSLQDVLVIGADRRHVSLTVRQVLRARTDGPDRRVVLHCHDDVSAAIPTIRAVRGCRVGRVEREDAAGVVGAELLFLEPLRRGATVIVEYELVATGAGPLEHEYMRRLRLPMRQYLLEVRFDPAALPASCTAFSGETDHQPLTLDPEHTAHLVDTDCTAGRTGIRWTWPATGPDGGLDEGPDEGPGGS
jgi:hypothetical protein